MRKISKKTIDQPLNKSTADAPLDNVSEKAVKETIEDASVFESPIFWRVGAAVVFIVAIVFRFYDLPLKPFHHDEGVNGFFLTTLYRSGVYHYDPQNYHGPTLYYFALASNYLFGLNDFAVRAVPAVFGILCIAGILSLRSFLGNVGALSAATLIALSPGMVFISRYFIHEMSFVFFTFGVPLCAVKLMTRNGGAGAVATGAMAMLLLVCLLPGTLNFAAQIGGDNLEIKSFAFAGFFIVAAGIVFLLVQSLVSWENGRPIYLLLAAASAALAFATKETAFITFGTMLIAVICVVIWLKIWKSDEHTLLREPDGLEIKTFHQLFARSYDFILTFILGALVFGYVSVLFFSSFFTFSAGISGAFEAYAFWTKTGSQDHTQNGFFAYLNWLWALEAPLLVLGALGALIAFWKSKHRFAMFAALWAWGLFAAYSIIPYKTPWLAVNFILPLAMITGYGINELATSRQALTRGAAAFLAAIGIGVMTYQSINLNFYNYDDNSKPYIYAHTRREFLQLVGNIERFAEISGKDKKASILIVSPDYWPLPWYLREYSGAAFYGQIRPADNAEIVVGSVAQAAELEIEYSNRYDFIGTHPLRPGVDLIIYVRRDLTDKASEK